MEPGHDGVWDAFDGRPHALRMGLHPMAGGDWTHLPPAPDLAAELDRKAALLLERRRQVLALADDAVDAGAELARQLVEHLVADHSDRYRYRSPPAEVELLDDHRRWELSDPTLELAGRMVTEDWCLVRPGAPPTLGGAVLCSPNRWRLGEKMDRPITDIHDPVPGYRQRLAKPVDGILGGRRPAMWRRNWSIQSSPARFQPWADGPERPAIPEEVWVRSEYETLVRLPNTGWWVFGIQTSIRPLVDVAARPTTAARVALAVRTLDPDTAAYKDLAGWRAPLLAWLDATAAAVAQGRG